MEQQERDWFEELPEPPFIRDLWEKAVREVATACNDTEALKHFARKDAEALKQHIHREHVMGLMKKAGLFKGDPKPPEEDREALYAELDQAMGIT